jgi:hypothetical protein
MKQILSLVFLIKTAISLSQPIIDWQICLGGSYHESNKVILPLTDGSFLVAGETSSFGDGVSPPEAHPSDIWIIKLTPSGIIEWNTLIIGSGEEFISNAQATSDGGYILSGSTNSANGEFPGHHGAHDILIIKLNSDGNIEWQKVLGGSSNDFIDITYTPFKLLNTTILANDGGFIIAGHTSSQDGDVIGFHTGESGVGLGHDIWIVKIDFLGNILWQKTLGGTKNEKLYSIIQTSSENILVMGKCESIDGDVIGNHGYSDVWLVELNTSGEILWQRCYGGSSAEESNSEDDFGSSIHETFDGGFLFTSTTRSNDGDVLGLHDAYPPIKGTNNELVYASDIWVVKIDSLGEIVWQKCLGSNVGDLSYEIIETADGGSLVSGRTFSMELDGIQYGNDGDVSGAHGLSDHWMVKLNPIGEISWQRCLGGSDDEIVIFAAQHSTIQSADGGYISGLMTKSYDGDVQGYHGQRDIWVVKLDNLGNLVWQKCLGGSQVESGTMIHQSSASDMIVMGNSNSDDYDVDGNMGHDIWVAKLSDINSNISKSGEWAFQIYPNPTCNLITVSAPDVTRGMSYSVYDISGKEIYTDVIEQNLFSISFENSPQGIYTFITENGMTSRIVKY